MNIQSKRNANEIETQAHVSIDFLCCNPYHWINDNIHITRTNKQLREVFSIPSMDLSLGKSVEEKNCPTFIFNVDE